MKVRNLIHGMFYLFLIILVSGMAIATEADSAYVQDTNVDTGLACTEAFEIIPDFWNDDDRLWFDDNETYEAGDLSALQEGEYENVFSSVCLENTASLSNPSHDMGESIFIDSIEISYYEDGVNEYDSESLKMEIEKDALIYRVNTGYIPLETLTDQSTSDTVDYEWRGKIIFLGEEYYVKDVVNPTSTINTKIYLCKGMLVNTTSEGFLGEYKGYKFKVDHLIYAGEYEIAGVILDVQKPDSTFVEEQVSCFSNGVVDELEIYLLSGEYGGVVEKASLLVYDNSTEVILDAYEDLVVGGEEKNYWEVSFRKGSCAELGCATYVPGYGNTGVGILLAGIDVTYSHDLDGAQALEVDDFLGFPNNLNLTFKGYRDFSYNTSPCSGAGEGNIVVERGSEDYQLVMSFTGEDSQRYNDVRLDEGTFILNDYFMLNHEIYQFTGLEEKDDTTFEITLTPAITGTAEKITVNSIEDEYGITSDLTERFLSLHDALDDDDPTKLFRDEEEDYTYEDLFAAPASSVPGGDAWLLYDDSAATIFFLDADTTNLGTGAYNPYIEINPDVAMGGGTFDKFQVGDNTLDMSLVKETGTDASLTYADESDGPTVPGTPLAGDMNCDGDDEDLLVKFVNGDNEVFYLDFSDRNYDEALNGYYCDNNIWYDCDDSGGITIEDGDLKIDQDEDTLLILPKGGDEIEIDWGVDYFLESVEICHPQNQVDASYSIGSGDGTITSGDINSDGSVNLFDLAMLGQAWGSSSGDANWNSAADLNSDATINLFDLAILGQNWG